MSATTTIISTIKNKLGEKVGSFWQPEVAFNYSCLFFVSIHNFFMNTNYFKKVI
jgi:hypothetical protein